jgi:(p)ppGpp synthase/HD superfamily hydrolase
LSGLANKARELAEQAHEGQVDKAGRTYIEHPAVVASRQDTDEEKAVAWLHDVLEDTEITKEYLAANFSENVVRAVDALTHREGESYAEYIGRIQSNPLATKVKLADLAHNMDLARIPHPTEKDLQRVEKYQSACIKLSS